MEYILNDVERTNQRATLNKKEVSTLKERFDNTKQTLQLTVQIQRAPVMEKAVGVFSRSSLETELAAKENEISQLADDIQSLQSTVNYLKEASASQIIQLEETLIEKNKTIQELEEKLIQQKDYEEIKKELSILKSVDFSDSRNDSEAYNTTKSEPVTTSKPSLKRSTENTVLKECSSDLSGSPSHKKNNIPSPFQTVETFGSLLGEEIVSTYTSIVKKDSPSTLNPSQDIFPDTEQSMNDTKSSPSRDSFKSNVFPFNHVTLDKFQECLTQCMEKYVDETLNTLNISRCVRELLSMNNIGQRVFAKFVLGLSQGTVSELLSKPKPWEKLTEKGRDSYRKMHAWASDDKCIYMLRALVPKKGKDSGLPSSKQEDPVAEERITQILNEAQHAILNSNSKNKKSPLHNGNTGYCSQNGNTPRSEEEREGGGIEGGGGNDGSLNSNNDCRDQYQANNYRRSRKYDNDDIPKEMVSRIYQEELAKLMGQRVEEGFCLSQNQYERTQEEIRHALNIYHQELSCLSQVFPLGASDLSHFTPAPALTNETACTTFSHPNSIANTHPRQEMPIDATVQSQNKRNEQRSGCGSETDSTCHHGSAFSLVRPKTEAVSSLVKAASSHQHNSNLIPLPPTSIMSYAEMPNSDEDLSTSASPLQQMQSITNSLLSQSSLTSISNNPQKPTKAILPPITQQQFDQYNNLNTEEIVKNVKEHLSQYSISQRLFGENILGLSQGSVSDLLARPKPWHMLTQKGREPFIRMKIFLEDENAVHKLVASQYKLPPEKLMRIGGFGGSVNLPASSKLPHHPIESVSSHHSMFDKNQSAVNLKFPRPMDLQISTPSTAESSPSISLAPSSPTSAVSPTQRRQMSSKKPHHSPISVTTLEPSVYEMAALTTDLDTQSITSKIKDTLLAHNIGQKIFGELVLGLSQGSVSELLSKPKPWHMLSIKGREPFIRMQLWLTDPKNVEKLQSIKNQRRGANKRKRNHTDVEIPWSTYENHTYNYAFPPPSPYLSAKKSRFLFSEEQKEALRLVFSMDPYPSTATIEFLANELNLSVRTITNWFHNHRMRLKQQPFANSDDYLSNEIGTGKIPSAHTSGMKDGTKFDPVQFRLILNHRLAELTQEKNSNKTQKIWSSTILNSSALSTHDDSCTLDLSISSQRFPHRGNNYYELNSTSETASAGNDDHSNSEQNDDSSYSFERGLSESSDRESTDDQPLSFSTYDPHQKQTNLQKKATDPSSSSKRRKPAMPQWVDPGLELSPDSDLYSESEDNDIEPESKKNKEIINGVCVLQTGNFDLCMPKENTVRIEPAPAPDEHEVNPRSKKETTTKNNTVDSMNIQVSVRSDNKEIREDIKIDRKYNIERLERCLKDQEEGWDIDEETEKECNNNETCDGKHKHKTLGQMGVLMK